VSVRSGGERVTRSDGRISGAAVLGSSAMMQNMVMSSGSRRDSGNSNSLNPDNGPLSEVTNKGEQ
jgi:hypothetical protein